MFDYTAKDMTAALRKVGLHEDDTVMFHVSLGMFGVAEGITSQDELHRLFLECVRAVVGPGGTVLIPAYTYSLCRGERFDVRSSPSTIGAFPEFFRQQQGVVRSQEPILSVCGQGPKVKDLFEDLPCTCYGEDCLYARLVACKAKICTMGLGLNWATFLHHIEEISRVPYRYLKIFRGEMLDTLGQCKTVDWLYYARVLGRNAETNMRSLILQLSNEHASSHAGLGRSGLDCIKADHYFYRASECMRADPWIAAAGPPGDPLDLEAMRVPPKRFAVSFSGNDSLEQLALTLSPLPRESQNDASDAALKALATRLPTRMHTYCTGEKHGEMIIPEKWTCHEAAVRTMSGRTVFSLDDNPLHVMYRSVSFNGTVDRSCLLQHINTSQTIPDAIPFACNAHRQQWGFCCTHEQKESLDDEYYNVTLESDFSFGSVKVCETVLPGDENSPEIVLSAHIGFPAQFNDGLSGAIAGVSAVHAALSRHNAFSRRVGFRLLLSQNIEGVNAWVRQAGLRPGSILVELNMLATDAPLSLVGDLDVSPLAQGLYASLRQAAETSRQGTTPVGSGAFVCAIQEIPRYVLCRVLPSGHADYPYYGHRSSLDAPEFFDMKLVREAAKILCQAIGTCEAQ